MKKITYLLLVSISLAACTSKSNGPDVSKIQMDLTVKRLDQDFFAIDTNALDRSLAGLQSKYQGFLSVYLQGVLGADDPSVVREFYRYHKALYDSSELIYKDFTPVKKQLEQAFRYVKYYFPSYKLPTTVIPLIGTMYSREDLAKLPNGDLTPNFMREGGILGISLQFYQGSNFSYYSTSYFIDNVAPLFRSRRFAKEYIASDVMNLIADDLFPDNSKTKPLIEQMIERGKRWWLLDKFMPQAGDSVITGYTKHQLDWVRENEGLIWSYILKNEPDLYTLNPATILTYLGEAPFTNVFSQEDSPGNIGQWIGWQIVKKFAENNPDLKPEQVMQTDPKKILEEAKYKPK